MATPEHEKDRENDERLRDEFDCARCRILERVIDELGHEHARLHAVLQIAGGADWRDFIQAERVVGICRENEHLRAQRDALETQVAAYAAAGGGK